MAAKREFSVGEKVRIRDPWGPHNLLTGERATRGRVAHVRRYPHNEIYYAVDCGKGTGGHNCDGHVPNGGGWWIKDENLAQLEFPNTFEGRVEEYITKSLLGNVEVQ